MLRTLNIFFATATLWCLYVSCLNTRKTNNTNDNSSKLETVKEDTTRKYYTNLIDSLESVDLAFYLGKTVEELINNDIINTYKYEVWIDEPPGYLNYLCLVYSDKVLLQVKCDTLKYTPRYSSGAFDFESYLKEKITSVKLSSDPYQIKPIRQ